MPKSPVRTEQTPAGHLAEARLQMVLGYQLAQAAIVNAQDRRTRVLHTTAKGAERVRKTTERIVAAEKASLPLTAVEHAMLLELLHKVACARTAR